MTELQGKTTRDALVDWFLKSSATFLSGEQISHRLGISRTAVWKQIKGLERLGFQFEATTKVGYRLVHAPDELMQPLVHRYLPDSTLLGRIIDWAPERESTNVTAVELAKEGAVHGTVVSAGRQIGGRGRQGRVWSSPLGGMWFSVIVRNPCAISQAADLTLLASVAVRRALAQAGVETQIKWPNDILLNGKKICGILAQMRTDGEQVEYAVIGIGMNVNFSEDAFPDDIRNVAATIYTQTHEPMDRSELLAGVLMELDGLYQQLADGRGGFELVLEEWKGYSHTLGRRVRIRVGDILIEGTAENVDSRGCLQIRDDSSQLHYVPSGEVLFSSAERV